jgi:H+-transporting ATPase
MIFLTLALTGQANIYFVRERNHFWSSAPSFWMAACSIIDVSIIATLAIRGWWMAPLEPSIVLELIACVAIYYVLLDFIKVRIFKKMASNLSNNRPKHPESRPTLL